MNYSTEFNSTQLNRLFGKTGTNSDFLEKINQHVPDENEFSLALFYFNGEYVGSGALISLKYVLTVDTVTKVFKKLLEKVVVNFKVLGDRNEQNYFVLHIVKALKCLEFKLVEVTISTQNEMFF